MPVVLRAIKPKAFNEQAMKAAIKEQLEAYSPFVINSFEDTTFGWRGAKPTFKARHVIAGNEFKIEVRISGDKKGVNKWTWLDEGTRPHVIVPRRAKWLRFRLGYSAGSRPGRLMSYPSKLADGHTLYRKRVVHPGTQARRWLELISKEHERPFARWMEAALGRAARLSGHDMSR